MHGSFEKAVYELSLSLRVHWWCSKWDPSEYKMMALMYIIENIRVFSKVFTVITVISQTSNSVP